VIAELRRARLGVAAGLVVLALGAALASGCSRNPKSDAAKGPPSSSSSPTRSDSVAGLRGIGATVADYRRVHPDGSDGYAAPLSLDGSKVLAYVRTLADPVAAKDAKSLLMEDLPVDARVVKDLPLAICEQIWIRSDLISSVLGSGFVVVKLSSAGAPTTYDPTMVSVLTFDNDLEGVPGSMPC
jgi:hypothetical protein